MPRGVAIFLNVEHDAAVTGFTNLILEREFEGIILFLGDDIPRPFGDTSDGSIDDLPPVRKRFFFVVPPMLCRVTVKKEFPSATPFGFRKGVDRWLS